MKSTKLISVLLVAVLVVLSLSTSASAFTSSELSVYLTGAHQINGQLYEINETQKNNVREYLNSNPVSDDVALQVKNKVEEAKNELAAAMNKEGVADAKNLSAAAKKKVVALIQQAGSLAGVVVVVDTVNESITIQKPDGTILATGPAVAYIQKVGAQSSGSSSSSSSASTSTSTSGSKFVYTGSNNIVFVAFAVIAVVAVSAVFVKKVYAK